MTGQDYQGHDKVMYKVELSIAQAKKLRFWNS